VAQEKRERRTEETKEKEKERTEEKSIGLLARCSCRTCLCRKRGAGRLSMAAA